MPVANCSGEGVRTVVKFEGPGSDSRYEACIECVGTPDVLKSVEMMGSPCNQMNSPFVPPF